MKPHRSQSLLIVALLAVTFAPATLAQTAKPSTPPTPAKNSQKSAVKTEKAATSHAEPWKKIPIPPLPAFKPAQPTRIQLANGMVIFLQEDHELPLVGLTTTIRGGSRMEPPEKVGLVDMYGQVWRTGGTTKRTGDDMDDFLEARAAKLETGGGGTSTSISFNCLKQDFNDVFAMYMELLQDPAFRENKLKLSKDQMRTGISRRNDESDSIAGRESAQLAYGKESPYAREPEYATVDAVTREDLVNWHKKYTNAGNIILGVVGDFDSKHMEARLRQAFESWPKTERTQLPTPAPKPSKPGYYVVNKEDVNQSEIRIVGLGIERSNPDYFAVTVMNEIFGGGFSSRLFTNLRTKRGLAYSVGGGVGSGWDHAGMTELSMGTKSATTVEGVQGLFSEVDDLLKSPATPAELSRAKDSILNGFIFNFDTPAEVLRERMTYEFFGYPLDFLERYRAGIEKVTIADVQRVAPKYMQKNQLTTLIVGNATDFEPALSKLGAVIPVDITIPEPGGNPSTGGSDAANTTGGNAAPTAAPKASNPEGKALIAKVVQFLGGKEKLQSVKAIRQTLTSVRKTPQGEMPIAVDQTIVYPDRVVAVANLMGMELRNVVTPSASFMVTPQGVRDMTGSGKDEAQRTVLRDLLNIAKHADDPAFVFAADGTERAGDITADVMNISGGNMQIRWLIDPKTGAVLESSGQVLGQSGPVQRTTKYSDWKPVDGLNLYYQRTVFEGGENVATDTVKEWTINPQVDEKLFERPAEAPKSQ
jgi:zinc protease